MEFYEQTNKLHEDDEYQSFEEWIYEEYKKDPSAFSETRDTVYCFTNMQYTLPFHFDKWTLIDADRGIVYVTFDNEGELADFLKPQRVNRALKRILMDKLVDLDPDSTFSFLIKDKLNMSTIQLVKGCITASPLRPGYDLFKENAEEERIAWYTENNTRNHEQALCCELYKAGMHNKMIDAHWDNAELPY